MECLRWRVFVGREHWGLFQRLVEYTCSTLQQCLEHFKCCRPSTYYSIGMMLAKLVDIIGYCAAAYASRIQWSNRDAHLSMYKVGVGIRLVFSYKKPYKRDSELRTLVWILLNYRPASKPHTLSTTTSTMINNPWGVFRWKRDSGEA